MNSFANRTNPFVMMLDPEAVINAMESSQPLRGLRGRVCRPLDKPLLGKLSMGAELEAELVDLDEDLDDDVDVEDDFDDWTGQDTAITAAELVATLS